MKQSFVNYLLSTLDSRWDEISILLTTAKDCEQSNERLHDAICRSICVLMVAHFEGFYKDLIKNVIEDLKVNNNFSELSTHIQRNYCGIFIDPKSSPETKNKITESLIEKFKEVNIVIAHDPFLFTKNENPKPQIIEQIFENLGIKKIFEILASSDYEVIFQEENGVLERKIGELRTELNNYSYSYPYEYDRSYFNMNPTVNKKLKQRTLWQEFLDEINRRRHGIAHGTNIDNHHSVEELNVTKNKLRYLQLVLLHVIIEFFGTVRSEQRLSADEDIDI